MSSLYERIMLEDPEDGIALLMDLPDVPDQYVTRVVRYAIEEERKQEKPKFVTLARRWYKRLKFIDTTEAKSLIRTLLLEQTQPFNDVFNPDDVDAYTGEPPVEDQITDTERLSHISASINPWNQYIALRKPYPTPEENRLFVEANISYPGHEDEELPPLDDREYVPAYLIPEAQPDDQLGEIAVDLAPAIKEYFQTKDHAPLLEAFQRHADGNPANLARVWLQWGLDSSLRADIKLKDPCNPTLEHYIRLFLPELTESVEAMGPVERDSVSDAEIEDACDRLTDEYLDSIKDTAPVRSRHWVEGYINAIVEHPNEAADRAWSHWRMKTSPKGAAVYAKAITSGASRREAMSEFYKVAGHKTPKRIYSVSRSGVTLAGGRQVSWSTALKILNNEGFELSQKAREALKRASKPLCPEFARKL